MSFILDALKKSENDRQDATPAEFTTVASTGDTPSAPVWLWVLGALLAVNAVVLAIFLLRPDAAMPPREAASTPVAPAAEPAAAPSSARSDFSAQIAEARRDRPAPRPAVEPAPSAAQTTVTGTRTVAAPPAERAAAEPTAGRQTFLLPTLTELRTNGTLDLPDMHLDIHVYSEVPSDRFVFINMSKYRERASTKEGPAVTEITPDGVVLDYQGRTFLLPRE